jgi:hypothetical protein
MALAALVTVLVVPGPSPAAGAPAPPKILGPVLSRVETPNVSLGRDGGFSTALPNGFDFWVFADTPRYAFRNGKWRMVSFITGSTAGMAKFTPGKPLTNALSEIRPGAQLRKTNAPAQFMPTPVAYLPDGSGTRCDRGYLGQRKAFSVRWPVGAALMPDKINVLVPYAVVCVLNESDFYLEGWGFSLFNYKTQRFTLKAKDVIKAKATGEGMPSEKMYGSPLIHGDKVTFYSWKCCTTGTGVYSTTVPANAAALKNPASYVTKLVPSLPGTYNIHAARKSKYHNKYTMYVLTGERGEYGIYTATAPQGPWKGVATGVLPRCNTSPVPCHSMALHPELSPAGRLIVSYHLSGYGPGIPTKHPYPYEPLRHVVQASIPCKC